MPNGPIKIWNHIKTNRLYSLLQNYYCACVELMIASMEQTKYNFYYKVAVITSLYDWHCEAETFMVLNMCFIRNSNEVTIERFDQMFNSDILIFDHDSIQINRISIKNEQ